MDLYVGTSGYSYKAWKGAFYPEDLPARGMLPFYAQHFRTVEINNTFHRMPTPSLIEGWGAQVPAFFRFSLKAPQRITHFQRLVGADESLSYFLDVAGLLDDRLGPILFQLPPNLKRDLPLLRDFFLLLPPRLNFAVEFRDASWFTDEVVELLARHRVALCLAEGVSDLKTPLLQTAPFAYLRLRRQDYTDADLEGWAKKVHQHDWQSVFVYFKHEDEARGILLARRFLELAT